MLKRRMDKTIEQIDYELKAKGKFPPDKKFPLGEQAKQKSYFKNSFSFKIIKKIFYRLKK